MRVMTFNIWDGGVNEWGGDRRDRILTIIQEANPDLVAIQEANEFDRGKNSLLAKWSRKLKMKGKVVNSPSGFHVCLLARPPLKILSCGAIHKASFYNACLSARVATPLGDIRLLAVHLNPFDPGARLTETRHISREAYSDQPVLLLGDFNAFSSRDTIDESVLKLPQRFLARHIAVLQAGVDGKPQFDTRAIGLLEWAGFVDIFRKIHPGEPGWTIPTKTGRPRESAHMRLDYIFATEPLAKLARECDVVRTPASNLASDHYPLIAEFSE